MHKKIINCFHLLFLIITISILSGCGAGGSFANGPQGEIHGIPYEYNKTFNALGEDYSLLIINDFEYISLDYSSSSVIHYMFKEYRKPDASYWTINYYENNQYIIDPNTLKKEVLNEFYKNINDVLIIYENHLGLKFDAIQDEKVIEKELSTNNLNGCESILVIDILIPFKIINKSNNVSYLIYVPVKTVLGYKYNDELQIVYNDKNIQTINYHHFIISKKIIYK